MDPEFDALAEDVTAMSIYYNPNSAKEKFPRIKRQIRVWKEQCQAIKSSVPYKICHICMVVEPAYFITL
eukprot:804050-Ditylum_brightwellii.AAC.1